MLAPTPPMGWNSWNTFGADVTEDVVKETADAFVREGLKDAGYHYVVIDDFWEADERDAEGRLQAHPERFPGGIAALADYVHARGLKFGIYSCAGTHTCGGRLASYGREEIDAQTFADWGVDFLKYDFCYKPLGVDGPSLYRRMGQALRATGRPILFSACEWGTNKPWEWGPQAGCHMWRTTGDIVDSWDSIVDIGFRHSELASYAGPNRWNDPDMLVVGMRGKGNVAAGGCTDSEYRVHFALWCMLAAPLMLGCDVRNMDAATKALITHPGLLAINQDPMGVPAVRLGDDWNTWDWANFQVWQRPLADGSIAVALFNLHAEVTRKMIVAWEALSLSPTRKCRVVDVVDGADHGLWDAAFWTNVPPHDVRLLRLIPT